jgi:hypothetical protein
MTIWPKDTLLINGMAKETIAPIIISASRATDIPAFYARQFIDHLKRGYLLWTNPFNGIQIPVSLKQVRLIVFWTKNPAPLIPYLRVIDDFKIDYYFSYTLNNYENEGLESKLPSLEKRIETFVELANRIGKDKVIWRFDPVVLLKDQTHGQIIDKIVLLAERLHLFTAKLVFSFVDNHYKKVQRKIEKSGIQIHDFTEYEKELFARQLSEQIKKYNLQISTCAEPLNLEKYNIKHNKCIDDELITHLFPNNQILIDFIKLLSAKNSLKDKGQRKYCGCIPGKDIGKYNTCKYNCIYCYAINSSKTLTNSHCIFD